MSAARLIKVKQLFVRLGEVQSMLEDEPVFVALVQELRNEPGQHARGRLRAFGARLELAIVQSERPNQESP
jgi:hypothetical protein